VVYKGIITTGVTTLTQTQTHGLEATVFDIDELLGKLPGISSDNQAAYRDLWGAVQEENEETEEAVLKLLSGYIVDGQPQKVIEAFDLLDALYNGDDSDDNTETGNMDGDVPGTDGGEGGGSIEAVPAV
jgi:hypothetical protein